MRENSGKIETRCPGGTPRVVAVYGTFKNGRTVISFGLDSKQWGIRNELAKCSPHSQTFE